MRLILYLRHRRRECILEYFYFSRNKNTQAITLREKQTVKQEKRQRVKQEKRLTDKETKTIIT